MDSLIFATTTLLIFAWGAAIGSFLNVVVYRLPAGLSLLYPPSRCPHCFHLLSARDNLPVLGWLWLRGRCRYCQTPIAVRYPLVEAATGLLFLLVFWQFEPSLQTMGYWAFFSWLLALALIDLDTLTLPNTLTQSGLLVGLGFQVVVGLLGAIELGTGNFLSEISSQLMQGVLGAVLGIWLLDLIALGGTILLGQPAMGGGDAKLAAMIGAWLGWKFLLLTGFLACAIGAVVGGGAIAIGLLSRRQPMPFGPFLALGAGVVTIWGEPLLSLYWRLFFPLV